MARITLSTLLFALSILLFGCNEADKGQSQLLPKSIKKATKKSEVTEAAKDKEVDIIENMSFHRKEYRKYLQSLIKNYHKAGNYLKGQWAKKELAALDAIPQYDYIIEASIAGPDLRAIEKIAEADDLYYEALVVEDKSRKLIVFKNDEKLRQALDKLNEVIRTYPTSNKIDDAAYKAGTIYEHFKDYSIAILYYQRTYQWDPATIYPARYKAACLLDKHLHRRAEALELYQESLVREKLTDDQRSFAQQRISELTQSKEKVE